MDDQPRSYVAPPSAPARPESLPPGADARRLEPAPESRPADNDATAPPRRGSGLRRILLWLVLAALVGAAVWYATRGHQAPRPDGSPPQGRCPLAATAVAKGDMPVTINALGTVTPLAMVTVRTQLNGPLTEVAFQEGQMVNKGDFLAQIDPRPYQAALAQAEGQLAKDQAALAGAEVDLARYQKLVAQNSVAKQTLDTQVATVGQDRGTVQADQASVDTQKLNLIYAHIVAPVSGRVGLRQIDPGNYVTSGDANGLVVITQLQPISAIFTVPERTAPCRRSQAGACRQYAAGDRARPHRHDPDRNGAARHHRQPRSGTSTGTVKLRATFPNTALNLFPNQFVNIKLRVDTLQNTAIVPSSAIQRGAQHLCLPGKASVDNTVTAQPVRSAPTTAGRDQQGIGARPDRHRRRRPAQGGRQGQVTEDATRRPARQVRRPASRHRRRGKQDRPVRRPGRHRPRRPRRPPVRRPPRTPRCGLRPGTRAGSGPASPEQWRVGRRTVPSPSPPLGAEGLGVIWGFRDGGLSISPSQR